MICPSPLRFISRIMVVAALAMLLLVIGIAIYMNTGQRKEEALETASRLPGQFVADCRKVSEESNIPWYYLAAYYQVLLEESGQSKAYPSKKALQDLGAKLAACSSSKVQGKLKELEGKKTAEMIIDRAKVLKKEGTLFSAQYIFPVKQNEIRYTDTWLAPRDGGERQHLGTDVFATEGTPVYACTGGAISRMGWNELGGNRIGLTGQDGIYYYYAHLHSYAPGLQEGSRVSKGQFLGTVGHTGNAAGTPDHLHFGMLLNWEKWINPYNFLVYWDLQQGQ